MVSVTSSSRVAMPIMPAAPPLGLIHVGGLPLDIAEPGQGEDAFLHRDQVLDIHLAGHGRDVGTALVARIYPAFSGILP